VNGAIGKPQTYSHQVRLLGRFIKRPILDVAAEFWDILVFSERTEAMQPKRSREEQIALALSQAVLGAAASIATRRPIETRVQQVHQAGISLAALMITAGCVPVAATILILLLVGMARAAETPASTANRPAQVPKKEPQGATSSDRQATNLQQRGPSVATGRVTDEQGQPIDGAEISVFSGTGTLFRTASAKTGKDGCYTLQYSAGAPYEATIIGPPRKDGLVAKNFYQMGGDWIMVPAASIAGKLVDEHDRPIGNRHLCLGGTTPPGCSVAGDCTTDANGDFRIGTLAPQNDFWFQIASVNWPRCELQSQPFHLARGEPYQAKLRLATSTELGMEQLEVVYIADAKGNDLTGQIDGAVRIPASDNKFKPVDPEVQAHGRAVLDEFIEANRYWLLGPPPDVKQYAYDFLLDGEAPLHIVVDNPSMANLWRRQGIAWHSGLHYLARHPDQAIFDQVKIEGDWITLMYRLRKMTFAADGDGIDRGDIYCGQNFYGGTLTVDRRTHTPSRHQCVVVYSRSETYSDFVEIDRGHYAPRTIEVISLQRRRWTFAVHGPGLWLFESNRPTTGRQPKQARIENVTINGCRATKRATAKQAAAPTPS
jgi:hypothetical protein